MTAKHKPTISPPCRLAFVGDIHGHVEEARQRLEALEATAGPIDCVFQVGDFMLTTREEDWASLAVPQKHKNVALTEQIEAAWEAWKWPTAMIGGNHDAYARLRRFRPKEWGGKLLYTDAGQLPHPIKGLRVIGLSGIYGEKQYARGFGGAGQSGAPSPDSWEALARRKDVNPKRLTYYRQHEIGSILALPKHPHVLMTHDWPIPTHLHKVSAHPHFQLLPALEPDWAFAGHLHTYEEQQVGRTRFIGLGEVKAPVEEWCVLMRWDGRKLEREDP